MLVIQKSEFNRTVITVTTEEDIILSRGDVLVSNEIMYQISNLRLTYEDLMWDHVFIEKGCVLRLDITNTQIHKSEFNVAEVLKKIPTHIKEFPIYRLNKDTYWPKQFS